MIFRRPEEDLHIFRRHPHGFLLLLHDLARHFAAQRRQTALQVADAGFAGVTADHLFNPRIQERNVPAGQAIFLLLLGDEEFFRDLDFFLLGIAGNRDHFHPVQQRPRNIVQRIGGNHPEHVRQVERQFDIVVAERIVLLGIEHLEQRRAGIDPEIRAHLVNLVQQKHRVLGPYRLHSLNDPARQCADIGAPVPAYLRLVPHAAKRHPDELARHRPGDRTGQRSLADAGRPDEAQNRPLHRFRQLPHRQVFQNPFLDLFQTVMILVQILFRQIDIQPIRCLGRPRQPQQPVEIGPDHAALSGHR